MKRISIIFFICLFSATFTLAQTAGEKLLTPTKGKRPLIIIPGVLGSKLVNKNTGEEVWFNLSRSKNDDLRLPMTSTVLSQNRDEIVVKDIIREVQLVRFSPKIDIYQKTLVQLQKKGGYQEGNWEIPITDGDKDTYYIFAYDWRRDNVESAQELIRKVENLKQKLGRPDLKFDILAHSMGGLVSRYAAMYGGADLSDKNPKPTWAGAKHFDKIFMFGTPNEGSFSAFDVFLKGFPFVGNSSLMFIGGLERDDVVTIPSLYQLLPPSNVATFLDENLQPLKLDLYSPETWKEYGWSVFYEEKFVEKLKDGTAPRKKKENLDDKLLRETTVRQARNFFVAALNRAKKFHEALSAGGNANSPIKFYALGSDCAETLSSPVLIFDNEKDRWLTLTSPRDIKTSDGKKIESKDVKKAMFSIGDGRVTKNSFLAEGFLNKNLTKTVLNKALPINETFFQCEIHDQLTANDKLQENFLLKVITESGKP